MKKTVLVAFGGASPEHEVSVLSAHQAIAALKDSEWNIKPLYIAKNGKWYTGDYLLELKHYENLSEVESRSQPCYFSHNEAGVPVLFEHEKKFGLLNRVNETKIHVVLTAFHGASGENGAFQGVCEVYRIPYTGSNVLASAIGMNKVAAKEMSAAQGIPVVPGVDFTESEWVKSESELLARIDELHYPVIVKPVNLGSSIGVKKAEDREGLIRAVEEGFRFDPHILVEKLIEPLIEVNCSVLGHAGDLEASVCERPVGKEELLSFHDKYLSSGSGSKGLASASRIIPADISDKLASDIQKSARKVFRALGCSGVARLDFLVNQSTSEFYFNEINTIPGSFSFYLWEESGKSFRKLLEELIRLAEQMHKEKGRQQQSYETNLLSKKAALGIKGLKNSK
mgnify:FL=1